MKDFKIVSSSIPQPIVKTFASMPNMRPTEDYMASCEKTLSLIANGDESFRDLLIENYSAIVLGKTPDYMLTVEDDALLDSLSGWLKKRIPRGPDLALTVSGLCGLAASVPQARYISLVTALESLGLLKGDVQDAHLRALQITKPSADGLRSWLNER